MRLRYEARTPLYIVVFTAFGRWSVDSHVPLAYALDIFGTMSLHLRSALSVVLWAARFCTLARACQDNPFSARYHEGVWLIFFLFLPCYAWRGSSGRVLGFTKNVADSFEQKFPYILSPTLFDTISSQLMMTATGPSEPSASVQFWRNCACCGFAFN